MRVYCGKLEFGSYVYNFIKDKKERVGRLFKMYFNKREDIKEVYVGEICVFVGLKDMLIGDMFCDEKNVVVLERMEFFELVIYIVVEFKMKVD